MFAGDEIETHALDGIHLAIDWERRLRVPGLEIENGAVTRVFDNQIFENNTVNFAPAGNIVGLVPTGTGVLIMANRNVHVFENEIGDNGTVNVLISSYRAEFQDRTGLHRMRRPVGNRNAIKLGAHVGACERDPRVTVEAQRGAGDGQFERSRALFVACELVGET